MTAKNEDEFNITPKRQKVTCICDFCGEEFTRIKDKILRGRKSSIKDACLKCVHLKKKENCLTNKGVEHPFQDKTVKDKIKITNLKKYGTENPAKCEEVKKKIKNTNLHKYGVEYPLMLDEIQEKRKKTLLENYGVEWPTQSTEIKDKIKNICVEKYGVTNINKSELIRNKTKQTCLEKYGVEYYYQSSDFKNKSQQTCIDKYGVPFPTRKFGQIEKEIQEWLNSYGFNFKNDISILNGKEIDLYDPTIKVGIEYCGLYWHNEISPEPRNKFYHYNKFIQCQKKGIRLLTIFEDEWLFRKEQCKNFIVSLLNKHEIKYYARNCNIEEISKDLFYSFCNDYHIQGKPYSHIKSYGVYNSNNDLCGVMGLGKHPRQHKNKDILVLNRLCFKNGISVVGGASKLFKQCLGWAKNNKYNKIISWSDNRWSVGNVYFQMNFNKSKELKPDYSYVDLKHPGIRYSKQSCKKKNINCPEGVTEKEWMMKNNFARIWDCGKIRWEYIIN